MRPDKPPAGWKLKFGGIKTPKNQGSCNPKETCHAPEEARESKKQDKEKTR
ncbi:MAG: hypothetical protein HY401_05845 [Elusimicrobia bacterium]|nr:hypothetical protein [Elusimicrobiota bacterium]